jgi:chromosome segregation ATPase
MPRVALLAAAFATVATALSTSNVAVSSLDKDRQGPMTKVVKLLEDMEDELQAEAKKDKDVYEALTCWCKSNEEGKGQQIEVYKTAIDGLEALIEGSAAKTGELATTCKDLKNDIAENEQALKEATELRKEEAAAFHKQEKDLLEAVSLLKGAITALSKHNTGLIQSETDTEAALQRLRPELRKLVHRHLNILGFLGDAEHKDTVLSMLNANADILEPDNLGAPSFLQRTKQPAGFKSYAPQSGQIFGVLQQMKDAFEADLPEVQSEEAKKVEAFALLKGEKESQIAAYKASYKEKWALLAETKEKLITAKDDLKDTRASMSADNKFLLEMTERCTAGDYEYEKRTKMRNAEITAVADAIAILSSDEARDGQQATFGKKAASFVQVASVHNGRREQLVAALEKASANSPQLALLATMAKSDAFAKVVKAIDDLVAQLKAEQADEVKQRDSCVNELHENEVDTERTNAELRALETKIDELGEKIKTLKTEIAQLKADIKGLQVEMQRASVERKAQNFAFRAMVKDQKNAQGALQQAYDKLAAVYISSGAFMQQKQPLVEGAATSQHDGGKPVGMATPEFEDYSQNSSSNSVLTLIKKLQGETKIVIDESIHDEQNAQTAYETLIADTNASIKAKSRAISDKTGQLAETEKEYHMTMAQRDRTVEELGGLADTLAAIHKQCDFLLKNFEARQSSRSQEMDALAEAKAIVSGMK